MEPAITSRKPLERSRFYVLFFLLVSLILGGTQSPPVLGEKPRPWLEVEGQLSKFLLLVEVSGNRETIRSWYRSLFQ